MTFKELFSDWVEPDIAEYYLACLLGLMTYDASLKYFWEVKSVFNTRNKFADMLFAMLEQLVEAGVLEENEYTQYRWNNLFKESWHAPKS